MGKGFLFGGIEAGGTKFVCAIGTSPDNLVAEVRFPTTSPRETIAKAASFFQEQGRKYGEVVSLGIASFGPLDPNPASPTYGYITSTPKPGWAFYNFVGDVHKALNLPVGFDTDVNIAALGEWRWGAAQGLDTFIYLTIGTGIGGGFMANGKLVHGLLHTEMGHMYLPHDVKKDPFAGVCPYHKDCLEGLACGPAIEKRWGRRGEELPIDHPAWELEASYLAYAAANLVCTHSPQKIIFGGGIMQHPLLLIKIRHQVQRLLNGYIKTPRILEEIDQYIVSPGLGGRSGVLGAIALAEKLIS
jgi:fructokinase